MTRNSEDWHRSILSVHSFHFAKKGHPITVQNLKSASYAYPGMIWDYYQYTFCPENKDDDDEKILYNEMELRNVFENHNQEVLEYFTKKAAAAALITIDYSKDVDYKRLYSFMGKNFEMAPRKKFPHLPNCHTQKKISSCT